MIHSFQNLSNIFLTEESLQKMFRDSVDKLTDTSSKRMICLFNVEVVSLCPYQFEMFIWLKRNGSLLAMLQCCSQMNDGYFDYLL